MKHASVSMMHFFLSCKNHNVICNVIRCLCCIVIYMTILLTEVDALSHTRFCYYRYVNIHCTSSIDTASECQTMLAFYMQTLFNCLLNDVKHSLNFHEVSLKKVIFSVRQYNSYQRKSYFI